MSLMFIGYKVINVFRINRKIDVMLSSIEKAMTLVLAFVFFIGIVMIGMTIIALNIWGPFMVEFKNFSDAFLAIFFLHMGLLNFEYMRYYNVYWSFGFVIIYTIFVIYILLSSFMTFFIDSYRRVTLQHGQPL